MVTGAQIRAARALLNLSQESLAAEAQITRATLTSLENHQRLTYTSTVEKVVGALEAAGIVFVHDERGRGVMLTPMESKH